MPPAVLTKMPLESIVSDLLTNEQHWHLAPRFLIEGSVQGKVQDRPVPKASYLRLNNKSFKLGALRGTTLTTWRDLVCFQVGDKDRDLLTSSALSLAS